MVALKAQGYMKVDSVRVMRLKQTVWASHHLACSGSHLQQWFSVSYVNIIFEPAGNESLSSPWTH